MASSILVKVVGFGEAERHSLNTLFRLSEGSDLTYGLWTSDSSKAADVVLIDVDSHDANAEMALAEIEADGPKLICVGDLPVESAWRSFKRPVDWGALVGVLDAVFVSEIHNPFDAAPTESPQDEFGFDGKVCLLVGFDRENALYLRARLALAGMCDVDEADSVIQANAEMRHRHYGLVIVDMGLNDLGTWGFVQALTGWDAPRRSVVVASAKLTRKTQELADQFGCAGVLGIPFEPQQVCNLLLRV
jgi:CheY-like chemotaxis protein